MNILVIGAVNSTKWAVDSLLEHGFNVVGVMGQIQQKNINVSGWYDLKSLCHRLGLNYFGYQDINNDESFFWAKEHNPDIIFAIGFSQLLKARWLSLPTHGCIGFHPTQLPFGRGRAPLAWLILDDVPSAVSIFLIDEGADSGPVFVQEPYNVEPNDTAASVERKIEAAFYSAMNKWLPLLFKGEWNPLPQDDLLASWYGLRKPEDGVIDWNKSATEIDKLVRASSRPHPGAYSFYKNSRVLIWDCALERNSKIRGVVGRILKVDSQNGALVQCGKDHLWIKKVEWIDGQHDLRVGQKFGFNIENEIYILKKLIENV